MTPNPLRTLGADQRPDASEQPVREVPDAMALLTEEFERALALKSRLTDEAPEKVGATARTLVASLEGMGRFAMKMRLVTAPQVRELFAGAKARGLYDGWEA